MYVPDFVRQSINVVIGFVIAIIIIRFIIFFLKPYHRETFFDAIVKVLEKIARGNFKVRVDDKNKGRGPFGVLVKSINDMAQELDKIEDMRQNFISDVSHEIQSPLTSIRGYTRILMKADIGYEERMHYLDIIESESTRLSRLSNNLLKLASLDSKAYQIHPENYRLDEQIREIIIAYEPQWSEKKIDMEISFNEIDINADKDMLSQVWNNLVGNAVKFTPEGGHISIKLNRNNGKIIFVIDDTGPGIPPEDGYRIFERFYKADKSRNPAVKGSGLGLSITKKIIEMNNGSITFSSKPGKGSEFTVILPASMSI